jgi:hypothetical protein
MLLQHGQIAITTQEEYNWTILLWAIGFLQQCSSITEPVFATDSSLFCREHRRPTAVCSTLDEYCPFFCNSTSSPRSSCTTLKWICRQQYERASQTTIWSTSIRNNDMEHMHPKGQSVAESHRHFLKQLGSILWPPCLGGHLGFLACSIRSYEANKGGRMNQLIIGFEPPGHRVQQVRQGMERIALQRRFGQRRKKGRGGGRGPNRGRWHGRPGRRWKLRHVAADDRLYPRRLRSPPGVTPAISTGLDCWTGQRTVIGRRT